MGIIDNAADLITRYWIAITVFAVLLFIIVIIWSIIAGLIPFLRGLV